MEVRPNQPAFLKTWQRDRLFVRMATDSCTEFPHIMLYPCGLGSTQNIKDLIGMRAIKIGALLATLNALHALLAEG
jgi:hypothetical protein